MAKDLATPRLPPMIRAVRRRHHACDVWLVGAWSIERWDRTNCAGIEITRTHGIELTHSHRVSARMTIGPRRPDVPGVSVTIGPFRSLREARRAIYLHDLNGSGGTPALGAPSLVR